MDNVNPVEWMTESAKRSKAKLSKEKIQDLMLKRDQATEAGELPQARSLDQEIERIKIAADKIDESDVCNEFKRQASADADNRSRHCYNLAIYALENGKPDMASEALQHLDDKAIPTKGLLQALALDQKGQRKEAIKMLIQFLGENEFNRYYNVNLGLIYRKAKNSFLSVKYLIKTADLLRKSNGIYNMYELFKQANQHYEQGNLKKALEFYTIASSEIKEPDLWIKMGSIYREQDLIEQAVYAFREVLKIEPESEAGLAELRTIHDKYLSEGDNLMTEKKYHPAVEQYEKALSVFRLPETLEKASGAYRQLNSIKKSNLLLEERERLLNAEKEKEQERMRTALIIKAKMMLKKQKFQQAIEFLETAFAMKLDKNVYAQLTLLYKKFKGKDSVSGLEKRWNDMLIAKERAEAEAKRLEREQQEAEGASPES
jgi:tetratricopeptide (TPR) repeat protein